MRYFLKTPPQPELGSNLNGGSLLFSQTINSRSLNLMVKGKRRQTWISVGRGGGVVFYE